MSIVFVCQQEIPLWTVGNPYTWSLKVLVGTPGSKRVDANTLKEMVSRLCPDVKAVVELGFKA